MNSTRFFPWLAAALALTAPLAANAAERAQTTKWVNLRAGPDRDYPAVIQLPPNTPVSVQGCLEDYAWCDVVSPGGDHGWVYGGNLVYPYRNSVVPIYGYGPSLGIPIVGFAIGAYWGQYYRDRPWYDRQPHWAHRPPPRPRPIVVRPGYPPNHGGDGRPPHYGDGRPPHHGDGRPPHQGDGRPPHQGDGRPGVRPPPEANHPPQHGNRPPQNRPPQQQQPQRGYPTPPLVPGHDRSNAP